MKISKYIPALLVAALLTACDDTDIPVAAPREELPDVEDNISGDRYDYTATGKPERPFIHDYTASMMMKFYMAEPDRATATSRVYMTYGQALENIKAIDALTRGVHKIVYLVGWQFDGHDDRYPALNVFNEALKRESDATARDSYLWLRSEAKKYNTTVSIHMLVGDAYTNSPLWHEYIRNEFICRDASGMFVTNGVLMGYPMYWINLHNEWRKGYLQRRLDEITELADLVDAGTVHIDAFMGHESTYHDVTREMQETVIRKVFRYMRDKGIDVTSELYCYDRIDPMIGLQAAAWWNDIPATQRASLPRELAAGGVSGQLSGNVWSETGFLFGDNVQAEDIFHYDRGWNQFKRDFCTQTLPYLLYGQRTVESYDEAARRVTYSGDLVADAVAQTVKLGGVTVRDHNNLFMPAAWITESGYASRRWTLPAGWEGIAEVAARPITTEGPGEATVVPVVDGTVTLSLGRCEMISIQPL